MASDENPKKPIGFRIVERLGEPKREEETPKESVADRLRALREKYSHEPREEEPKPDEKREESGEKESTVQERLKALREKREGGQEEVKPKQVGTDRVVRIEKDGDLERFLQTLTKKTSVASPTGEKPSFVVSAVALEPQGLLNIPKTHVDVITMLLPVVKSEVKDEGIRNKAKVSSGECENCRRNLANELQQLMSKQELFIQNIERGVSGEITDNTQKNVVPHLKKLASMTKQFRKERNVIMDRVHHSIHAQLSHLKEEQQNLNTETEAKVKVVVDQIKEKKKALNDTYCIELKEKYGSVDEHIAQLGELLGRCAKVWKELLETVNQFLSTSQDNIEGAKILRRIQLASAAFSMVGGEAKEYLKTKDTNCKDDTHWLHPLVLLSRAQQLETAFAPVIAFLSVGEGQFEDVDTLKSKYATIKKKIDTFTEELKDVERKRMKPTEKKVISGSSVKDIVSKETKETSEDLNAKKTRLDEALEVLEGDRRKIVHQILVYKLSQYRETLTKCKEGLVALLSTVKQLTVGMKDVYSKYIAEKSLHASHGHEWLQSLKRTMLYRLKAMREAVCENIKRNMEDANAKLESSPHFAQMRGYVAQMKGFVMVGNPVVQNLAGQIMPSKDQDSHSFHKILIELSNFVRTCEMIEQLEKQWLSNSWSRVYIDTVLTV